MERLVSQKDVWNKIILNYLEPEDIQSLILTSHAVKNSVSEFHFQRAKYFLTDDPLVFIDSKNVDAIVFWLKHSHAVTTILRFLVRGPVNLCKKIVDKIDNEDQINAMLDMAYREKRSSIVAFLSLKRTDEKIEKLITALVFNKDMRNKIDQLKSKPTYLLRLQFHALRQYNIEVFYYIENLLAAETKPLSEKFAYQTLIRFFKNTQSWRKLSQIRRNLGWTRYKYIKKHIPRISGFFIKRMLQYIKTPTPELLHHLVCFTIRSHESVEVFHLKGLTKQIMNDMFQIQGYRGTLFQELNRWGVPNKNSFRSLIDVEGDNGITFFTNIHNGGPIDDYSFLQFLIENPCSQYLDCLMRYFSDKCSYHMKQLYEKYEDIDYPYEYIQKVKHSEAFCFLYFQKGVKFDQEYVDFIDGLPESHEKTRIQNILKRLSSSVDVLQ